MTLNIRNPEADRLARRLAAIDGISLTEAVVAALRETLRSRQSGQTAQIARSIRERHGVLLSDAARKPLPQHVWDDLHDDPTRRT